MTLRLVASCLLMGLVGCQPGTSSNPQSTASAEHDHGDHDHGDHDHGDHDHAMAADFATGLAEVEKFHQAIAAAYGANDPAKAEESLHEIGHVLEDLPVLAEKGGITGDNLAKVKAATRTIFDACYALDSAIHEGKPGDFESVKQPLIDALAELKSLAAPKAETP